MNIEILRDYCLSKKAVSESLPFDESTLVFKVGSKMFALTSLDAEPLSVNLKCQPEKAIELRETYEAILPGYHMNKKHWNTVLIDGSLSDKFVYELVDNSYNLVVKGMTKKERTSLKL